WASRLARADVAEPSSHVTKAVSLGLRHLLLTVVLGAPSAIRRPDFIPAHVQAGIYPRRGKAERAFRRVYHS
ncbi:MAG TPA: hypothetical protein VGJ46_09140, partial [Candidatus Limnocylindrales bacterium]